MTSGEGTRPENDTYEEGIEAGEADEQLVEGLPEGWPAQDGDGGAVAHQAADAHHHRQDPLADGAPQLRLDRHGHAHLWIEKVGLQSFVMRGLAFVGSRP